MKNIWLILIPMMLAHMPALSQTNNFQPAIDGLPITLDSGGGVQLTPDEVAKLNSNMDALLWFIPAQYKPVVLKSISVLGLMAVVLRAWFGFKSNGIAGLFHGLFSGTNKFPAGDPTPKKGASGLTRMLLAGLMLSACAVTARPQEMGTPVETRPASFWGGIKEAGTAFANQFKADTNAAMATNWTAVPFVSFDLDTSDIGYGIAVVHPLPGNYAYFGARLEYVGGHWLSPSINLQLQKTISVFGVFDVTPFTIGGTALFNGNVAAYIGGGANVTLWAFKIKDHQGYLGAVVDYEQWAGIAPNANREQVRAGASVSFSF